MKEKHFWRIQGFDGTELIYEIEIPFYLLSHSQMEELLRRLVSRHLSENEVVWASVNRKIARTTLLDIHQSAQPPHMMSCSANPHYITKVITRS